MARKQTPKTKVAKPRLKPIRGSVLRIRKEEQFFEEPVKIKMNVESRNALEDIKEILNPCIKCGMCKSLCPVFKTLKQEEISPRGHSIMLNEKMITELVFKCNLCKACLLYTSPSPRD